MTWRSVRCAVAGVVVAGVVVAGCSVSEEPAPTKGVGSVTPAPSAPGESSPAPSATPTAKVDQSVVPAGFSTIMTDDVGPFTVWDMRDGWVVYEQIDDRIDKQYLVTVTSHRGEKISAENAGAKSARVFFGWDELVQWAYTSPSFGTVYGISDEHSNRYEIRYWDVAAGTAPQTVWKSSDPEKENNRTAFYDGVLYFPRQDGKKSCLSTMRFDGKTAPRATIKNLVCSDQYLWWIMAAPDGTVSYLLGKESSGKDCAHLYRILPGATTPEQVAVPGGCVGRGSADATYAVWSRLPLSGADAGPSEWFHQPMAVMTTADGKVTELGDGEAGSELLCEDGVVWNQDAVGSQEVGSIMSWHPGTGIQIIYTANRYNDPDWGPVEPHGLYALSCFDNRAEFERASTVTVKGEGTDLVEQIYRTED